MLIFVGFLVNKKTIVYIICGVVLYKYTTIVFITHECIYEEGVRAGK